MEARLTDKQRAAAKAAALTFKDQHVHAANEDEFADILDDITHEYAWGSGLRDTASSEFEAFVDLLDAELRELGIGLP